MIMQSQNPFKILSRQLMDGYARALRRVPSSRPVFFKKMGCHGGGITLVKKVGFDDHCITV